MGKDKVATHTFHPSEVCFEAVYLLTKKLVESESEGCPSQKR